MTERINQLSSQKPLGFRSPKSIFLKSPKLSDQITTLLFLSSTSKSPSLKTSNGDNLGNEEISFDDEIIPEDQIMNEVVDIIANEEKNVWIYGLVLLFFSVISWISAVQLLNNIMKKTNFDHPIFSAYLNGSFFILFGFKSLLNDFKLKFFGSNINNINVNNNDTSSLLNDSDSQINESDLNTPNIQLSNNEIMKVGLYAAVLYFLNCFLGSAALKYTSASNQTILATSSSVFSLIIGVFFNIEKFTIGKLLSVGCSLLGISLITLSSTSDDLFSIFLVPNERLGDILAIIGALSYSCFLILFKIKLGKQTNSDNDSLVYGYLGFFTIVFGYLILIISNYFNWESLSLPDNNSILFMFILSGFLNGLSDYLGSCASLITSPLSVSLSLSTAIPISMILDSYFYGGVNFTYKYLLGILLILSSFIFTNVENEKELLDQAIENAIDEAINYDEQLSVILSPTLKPHSNSPLLTSSFEIPGFSIDSNIDDHIYKQRLIVTGGQNHKYFFREIKN